MKEQKEIFETLYNKTTDALILLDDSTLIDCNESTIKMLKFKSKEEFLNTPLSELSPEFQPDGTSSLKQSNKMIELAMKNGSHHFEWVCTKANKENFWVDIVLTKISLKERYIIHARWIDIDKQKIEQEKFEKKIKRKDSRINKILKMADNQTRELLKLNQKLEEATEKAQSASRAKSDFLSNMSHEIRTPMNAVLGFAELLDDNIKDKKLKSFVKTIRSSGQTLLSLINDILDLSKIEAGKLELVKSKVNIRNILHETINIFALQAEKKGLNLQLELDSKMPTTLILDPLRFKEILINLVGNALKFTDKGSIDIIVSVERICESTSKVDLTIRVNDTGIGINPSQQEKVFNIFEQSENQDIKKYGGTGLGLAISRKLATLMGGTLKLESQEAKGSSFIVNLQDIDIASIGEIDTQDEIDLEQSSLEFEQALILVVDDVKENRELIKESFRDTNINIIEAGNGEEAVRLAKEQKLDLILMDIRMPIMDGYTATRLIKEFRVVPIIALTASIMQNSSDKLQGEEFDAYLRKPVSKHELFHELSKFLKYIDTQEELKSQNLIEILNIEDFKEFKRELEDETDILYKKAISSNDFNIITEFATSLHKLSLKHNIEHIINYSELLLEKIETFEIDTMQSMLQEYKDLIAHS